MQTFKLETAEMKTAKNGNPYIKATILGEGEVSIFNEFPDFANLKAGSMVMGEIKVNGKYKNLVYASQMPKTGNSGAYKQKLMEETMKKKEASISHFQTTKEESIKISSTMRDAVLLAIAELGGSATKDKMELALELAIHRWRKWLWFEWEAPKKYIPFISNPKELEVDDYPQNDNGIPF